MKLIIMLMDPKSFHPGDEVFYEKAEAKLIWENFARGTLFSPEERVQKKFQELNECIGSPVGRIFWYSRPDSYYYIPELREILSSYLHHNEEDANLYEIHLDNDGDAFDFLENLIKKLREASVEIKEYIDHQNELENYECGRSLR